MEKFKKIINPTLDFCLYLLVGFVPIFYSPLFLNERELPQLASFYFLTAAALVLFCLKKTLTPKISFKIYSQDILIFLFLLVFLLSSLTAINVHTAIFGLYDSWTTSFLSIFAGFLFYLLLNEQVKNFKKANELFLFIVAGGAIASLSALWEYFALGGNSLFPQEIIRVSGSLGQPNYLGFYLSLVLPFSLSLLFSSKSNLAKIIFPITSILIALTLILTFSRASWLSLAFAISATLLFVFLKTSKQKFFNHVKKLKNLLIGLAIFSSITLFFLKQPIISRIKESLHPDPQQNTLLIRLHEWSGGIKVFLKRPLLGVGPENLYYFYGNDKDPWLNMVKNEWFYKTYNIRNLYLDFLVKTGLLGLTTFLVLVIYILKKLIQSLSSITLFFCFSTYLFFGFFYFITPSSLIFFWLLLSLIRLLTHQTQKSFTLNFSKKQNIRFKVTFLSTIFLAVIFLGIILRALIADYYVKKGYDLLPAEQGRPLLEKAISLNPHYSVYKRLLAGLYIELATESLDEGTSKINLKKDGQLFAQKALDVVNSAIETDPHDPVNYANLATWYFKLSSQDREYLKKSIFYAEKVLSIEKNFPDAWDRAGLYFLDLGNLEKAEEYFQKALELKPDFSNSHFHLGETLRQMGYPEKALPHYQLFQGERAEQEIKETLQEIEKKGNKY